MGRSLDLHFTARASYTTTPHFKEAGKSCTTISLGNWELGLFSEQQSPHLKVFLHALPSYALPLLSLALPQNTQAHSPDSDARYLSSNTSLSLQGTYYGELFDHFMPWLPHQWFRDKSSNYGDSRWCMWSPENMEDALLQLSCHHCPHCYVLLSQ